MLTNTMKKRAVSVALCVLCGSIAGCHLHIHLGEKHIHQGANDQTLEKATEDFPGIVVTLPKEVMKGEGGIRNAE